MYAVIRNAFDFRIDLSLAGLGGLAMIGYGLIIAGMVSAVVVIISKKDSANDIYSSELAKLE